MNLYIVEPTKCDACGKLITTVDPDAVIRSSDGFVYAQCPNCMHIQKLPLSDVGRVSE